MKKIGILTFQNACNFGAVLQAYALKQYLEQLSDTDVEIINYKNKQIEVEKSLWKNLFNNNLIKEFVRNLLLIPYVHKRESLFDQFSRRYLKVGREITRDQLKTLAKDVYIVGSDQIWNLQLTRNDTTYFCDFCDEPISCYSYAASIGKSKFSDEELLHLTDLLDRFSKISFRENELVPIFQKVMPEKTITSSLDPIFLLDKNEWEQLSVPPKREKYVLFFGVGSSPELNPTIEFAKKLAEYNDLEAVFLSDQDIWYKHRDWRHCGAISPLDFLGYIKNADYIVTNSFHATSFSILFHKRFYSETGLGRNGRILNILSLSGLDERALVKGKLKQGDVNFEEPNWKSVETRLEFLRKESKEYLSDIIKESH